MGQSCLHRNYRTDINPKYHGQIIVKEVDRLESEEREKKRKIILKHRQVKWDFVRHFHQISSSLKLLENHT